MAKTGRTVICTVHQPSSELFFMFDDLLLLQKGGYLVYFGPIGDEGITMIDYLETLPESFPCPEEMNPASWMLDILSGSNSSIDGGKSPQDLDEVAIDTGDNSASAVVNVASKKSMMEGKKVQELFMKSIYSQNSALLLEKLSVAAPNTSPVKFASKQARSWVEQFYALLKRQELSYRRDISLNVGRFAMFGGMNIVFGVIYFGISTKDIGGVSSLVAGVFMGAAFSGLMNMQAMIPSLIKNRSVYYREQASYMYDSLAYSLSLVLIEIPWFAFIIMTTLPIYYFLMGLSSDYVVYFFDYLVVLMLGYVFGALGFLFSSSLPTYETAQAVAGSVSPLTFLFGGLFAPIPSMPDGIRWVTWLDPIVYGFRAIIPIHFFCEGSGCPSIAVPSPNGLVMKQTYEYVVVTYDVDYHERWFNYGIMWIFFAGIILISMYNTKFRRFIVR